MNKYWMSKDGGEKQIVWLTDEQMANMIQRGYDFELCLLITPLDDRHYLEQQHEQPRNGKTHWRLFRDGIDIAVTKGRVSFEKARSWAWSEIEKAG